MSLPSPNLDDRSFADLVDEARQYITAHCPAWTDLSPGDPGIALVEVFAYLTEIMIYRFNRVPSKAYIEFLRLLGVTLLPPSAAAVELRFKLSQPATHPVEIPRGTRVTAARSPLSGEPPVFITREHKIISPGSDHVDVLAYCCKEIQGELAGTATGAPGFSVRAAYPPIIAPKGNDSALLVGIEAMPDELGERVPALNLQGKTFGIWEEVEHFAEAQPGDKVYVVDRSSGLITFAPALHARSENGDLQETPEALAAIPKAGREVRLWYCYGGGPEGNVGPDTVTVLKDPIPGISVTNPRAALGGAPSETLENALLRGPQELHSLRRAVTARDFELLARRSGAVSRAKAFTRAQLWTYALPGTVEVILVPRITNPEVAQRATAQQLEESQNQEALREVQDILEERRPLGTECLVNWARYKSVQVQATVLARPEEDPIALKKRVLDRLYAAINPLPTSKGPGWEFGEPIDVYTVYLAVLSEPGVLTVQNPRLVVDDVPEKEVSALAADFFQPDTWYAAAGDTLYRSDNNGDSWESIYRSPDFVVSTIDCNPHRAGWLAITTRPASAESASQVLISQDCGQSWELRASTQFEILNTAWITRDTGLALLLATSAGLYELSMLRDSAPVQVFVMSQDEQLGYWAVAVSTSRRGNVSVAVAARQSGGIFLSTHAGRGNTFKAVGLAGEDVRILAAQQDGDRSFLWAGLAAARAGDLGKGCRVMELMAEEEGLATWEEIGKGWIGGSCTNIAFYESSIFAATYDAGVLLLSHRDANVTWTAPAVQSGLPLVDRVRTFERIDCLAHSPMESLLMTGSNSGVFRSKDEGKTYTFCSRKVFTDRVALPTTWVFCSGDHDIEVKSVSEQ
jgi:hypothetical protein